jgi:5-methylcytosine-specific restriction endonuclease McrA
VVDSKPNFRSWNEARRCVLRKHLFICSYCLDDANEVDHIIPVSRMGPFLARHNLTAACRSCNQSKGALTAEEWFDRDWAGRMPPWFKERHRS